MCLNVPQFELLFQYVVEHFHILTLSVLTLDEETQICIWTDVMCVCEIFHMDGKGLTNWHSQYYGCSLQWRHNEPNCVSNHQSQDCLLNRYSGADQRKRQSSASLDFVRGIHRWHVNSRPNGQWHGKCFHLMTSSCEFLATPGAHNQHSWFAQNIRPRYQHSTRLNTLNNNARDFIIVAIFLFMKVQIFASRVKETFINNFVQVKIIMKLDTYNCNATSLITYHLNIFNSYHFGSWESKAHERFAEVIDNLVENTRIIASNCPYMGYGDSLRSNGKSVLCLTT